jgi:rubredoxin
MFLEYDWTFNVYRPRLGDTFTDVRGERSWESLADAKWALKLCGLKLGRKTDSRTWAIEVDVPPMSGAEARRRDRRRRPF